MILKGFESTAKVRLWCASMVKLFNHIHEEGNYMVVAKYDVLLHKDFQINSNVPFWCKFKSY